IGVVGEESGVPWKQVGSHGASRARPRSMSRWITGVVWCGKQGSQPRMGLKGTDPPVEILRIPASHHGVVHGHTQQRVDPGGAGRIVRQSLLLKALIQRAEFAENPADGRLGKE